MTNEEAIEILTKYNAWRRGDDTHGMGCVKQLGLAIDRAIEVLRAGLEQKPIPDFEKICTIKVLESGLLNSVNITQGKIKYTPYEKLQNYATNLSAQPPQKGKLDD